MQTSLHSRPSLSKFDSDSLCSLDLRFTVGVNELKFGCEKVSAFEISDAVG